MSLRSHRYMRRFDVHQCVTEASPCLCMVQFRVAARRFDCLTGRDSADNRDTFQISP
jgi:hypothetical protein